MNWIYLSTDYTDELDFLLTEEPGAGSEAIREAGLQ